jgi:hypothetical protein
MTGAEWLALSRRRLRRLREKRAFLPVAVTLVMVGGGVFVCFCYVAEHPAYSWGPQRREFPLRDDRPPWEWRTSQIDDGLPYRWESGIVHVLAWEVIEDDRPWKYTQVLVLKKFSRPTEQGGHTWVLAHLCHRPEGAEWPWRGPMRIPPPFTRDQKMPKLTDAQLFGYTFYDDLPTDKEVEVFLKETSWTPALGTEKAFFLEGERTLTTRLTAGGIDPRLWERLFKRAVPTNLFPELKKPTEGEQ